MGKEIEEPDIVFDFAESRAREKLATGMISDCNPSTNPPRHVHSIADAYDFYKQPPIRWAFAFYMSLIFGKA